jgi:hypothetical protein
MDHDFLIGVVFGLVGFCLLLLLIIVFTPPSKPPGGW